MELKVEALSNKHTQTQQAHTAKHTHPLTATEKKWEAEVGEEEKRRGKTAPACWASLLPSSHHFTKEGKEHRACHELAVAVEPSRSSRVQRRVPEDARRGVVVKPVTAAVEPAPSSFLSWSHRRHLWQSQRERVREQCRRERSEAKLGVQPPCPATGTKLPLPPEKALPADSEAFHCHQSCLEPPLWLPWEQNGYQNLTAPLPSIRDTKTAAVAYRSELLHRYYCRSGHRWLGAEVAVVGDFGLRENVPVMRLGYGFDESR
ncbi:uncharacterized protein DS421_18g617590 [Arachis hypogaea]|nr:uncharacterized protein DS421_18g617590 [Arachis hypogaea]